MEQGDKFVQLAPLITKLGIMLAAALVVERFLSIINWIANHVFVIQNALDWKGIKDENLKFKMIEEAIEEEKYLKDTQGDKDEDQREIVPNPARRDIPKHESRFDVKEIKTLEKASNEDELLIIQKEQNRIKKEFWLQILGTFVAILCCRYMKFSIWDFLKLGIGQEIWGYVFTGIIIGAGSKPVNFLINFLVTRKIVASKEEETKQEKPAIAESTGTGSPAGEETIPLSIIAQPLTVHPKSIEEIVGFKYNAGDRPERLEYTHLFPADKPIDLIIYHHTAMHSDSPFEEVIKEFDRKGWLTGYHCVILKDGSIHILCRWDRFANHAYGYNDHSMGIAFHGNFETDPKVAFSNYNGRYGIQHPTNEQIDSVARIVVLWNIMKLKKKQVSFPAKNKEKSYKGIVPHYYLKEKACPGNKFPHSTFIDRVKYYNKLWAKNMDFLNAMNEFNKLPMLG